MAHEVIEHDLGDDSHLSDLLVQADESQLGTAYTPS